MDKAALPNQDLEPRYDWRTPREIFRLVEWILGVKFNLDAFAEPHNTHCERFLTGPCRISEGECSCGFCASWAGAVVWANPPYGPDLERFAKKFAQEAPRALLIAGLVPPSMSQRYAHECLFPHAAEIWPITPRINFETPEGRRERSTNRYDSALYIAQGLPPRSYLRFRPLDWRRALAEARRMGVIE